VVAAFLGLFAGLGALALVLLGAVALLIGSISIGPCNFGMSKRLSCAGSDRRLIAATVDLTGRQVATRLRKGDDPNLADRAGDTALACAALIGNRKAVDELLAAGATPGVAGTAGGRPIIAAVSGEGRFGNEADSDGVAITPLTSPDRVAIVRALVKKGVSPDIALAPAAEKGNVAAIDALVHLGADPNGAAAAPSPLLGAVFGQTPRVVATLLADHADPNNGGTVGGGDVGKAINQLAPTEGFTIPLSLAGALMKLPDKGEVPPIVAAALLHHDRQGLLTQLLEARADPNALAFGRYSALWIAVQTRNYAAATVLRVHGAVPDPPGAESATAAAFRFGDQRMLTILQH